MLIVRMEEKNKLIPLLIEYAFDCLVTLDKVQNKVPTTTGYILRFLHEHGKVLLDKQKEHEDWWAEEECYKIKQKDGSIYYQNTEWEDDNPEFIKYQIKDKKCFKNDKAVEKIWKVGSTIAQQLKQIVDKKGKDLTEMVFEVTRSGSGKDSSYNFEQAFDDDDRKLKPLDWDEVTPSAEELCQPPTEDEIDEMGYSSED